MSIHLSSKRHFFTKTQRLYTYTCNTSEVIVTSASAKIQFNFNLFFHENQLKNEYITGKQKLLKGPLRKHSFWGGTLYIYTYNEIKEYQWNLNQNNEQGIVRKSKNIHPFIPIHIPYPYSHKKHLAALTSYNTCRIFHRRKERERE